MVMIKHTNYADKYGYIYCRKNNSIEKYTRKFRKNCLGSCKYRCRLPFLSTDKIDCVWEDNRGGEVISVKNPYEEYRLLNGFSESLTGLRNEIAQCELCGAKKDGETGLVNPFFKYAEKEHLLPLTTNYWSDLSWNISPDILFVGQDGGYEDVIDKYLEGGRDGYDDFTTENLEKGLALTGCRDRALFINAVLCMKPREQGSGDAFPDKYYKNCKKYLDAHISILNPQIVVPMGTRVTQLFLPEKYSNFVDVVCRPHRVGEMIFYPIYHLNPAGQINRERSKKKNPDIKGDFTYDFEQIAKILDR